MTTGQVIVLNGTTSAGKSTLAAKLQARFAGAGECWLVVALDDFFAKVPFAWVRLGRHVGAHAEEGIAFEMIDGEIERRIGPIGQSVIAGYQGAVAALARAGLNVIVDEVLLCEEDWDRWQTELRGLDVLWVALDLDLELVEARERERGDRVIGMARAQHDVVHRHATYDLRIDTGVLDVDAAVEAVLAARP